MGVADREHDSPAPVDEERRLFKNMGMPQGAIEIENLSKEYPYGFLSLKKKKSLEDLTMRVEDGEVFGFLGPNGAGKITNIKLLMRFIFSTAGTARILGKSIYDVSMHGSNEYF